MHERVKLGDTFQCKRRGHVIVVSAISSSVVGVDDVVHYRDTRGRMTRISAARLLKPSRFKLLARHAEIVTVA